MNIAKIIATPFVALVLAVLALGMILEAIGAALWEAGSELWRYWTTDYKPF